MEYKNEACTGKSLSEALILGSTNPQYDKRLFINLPVQHTKTTSSEHVVYINYLLFLFWHSEQFVYTLTKKKYTNGFKSGGNILDHSASKC